MKRNVFLLVGTFILLGAAALRIVGLSQYPPGPHYDEAANLIITRTIAYGGARPFPMVENYQGREVLYYYLGTPLVMTIHNSRFALQLLGAYSGLIMVACTVALGPALFGTRRGRWLGLAAGIVAAVSLPQVLLARQAFRAVTLPMMQALTLLVLWHGLRRGRWRLLATAGLLAGMTVYTYNSSRLFPVWLAVGGLVLVLASSGERWQRLRQGLFFFGVATLVATPFAIYGVRNPDIFLGRLYEVTGGPDEITLMESIWRHLRMFFIQGETLLRYNPRGRPYFTWLEGGLLLAGWVAGVWGLLRRQTPPLQRAAYLLLLLSPLMILPSVIATSGFPPNHMRSAAMVPLVFLVVALGAERLLSVLPAQLGLVLLGVGLAGGVLYTGRDYANWVTRADLYYATDADLASAATWAGSHTTGTIYVAAQDRYHPTVQVANLPDVRWLGTDTLFVPADAPQTVIFPNSVSVPDIWQSWLQAEADQLPEVPSAPDGRPAFAAYQLRPGTPGPLPAPPVEARNAYLGLSGTFQELAFPSGTVDVMTGWDIHTAPPIPDLTPIVHMEDTLGNVIARAESFSVGTDHWRPGETLLQRVPGLRVPVGTPPGIYPLQMTWVAREADQYLPYQGGGIWAQVGQVEVLRPTNFPTADGLAMDNQKPLDVAPGVRLLGWDALPGSLRPGEPLPLTLYWQGRASEQRANVSYSLHLGEQPLTMDAPTLPENPTENWLPGQLMTDRLRATIPREQPSGLYPLQLTINGTRHIELGNLTIAGVARQMTAPQPQEQVEASFDGKISLYGYTLDTQNEGLSLTLFWKSLAIVDTDYIVFVHLVSNESEQNIAQRDQMPQQNQYPTSLWQPGEYVEDRYHFSNISEPYHIRVGLYNQQTGQRLPLSESQSYIAINP